MMPDMERIYADYRNKVMGYIRARVQRWADAEDLCSDVFEKVQRKLGDFDSSKASVSTWIFTITRNTVIDYFRRSRYSGYGTGSFPYNSGKIYHRYDCSIPEFSWIIYEI